MKSPAFPLYVQDFLMGTRHFTTEETGAYLLLLIEQWDKGFVEKDDKFLRKISGISIKKIEKVLEKFEEAEKNKLVNRRLEAERKKQIEFRENRSNSGKDGMKKRWGHIDKTITQLSEKDSTVITQLLPSITNKLVIENKENEGSKENEGDSENKMGVQGEERPNAFDAAGVMSGRECLTLQQCQEVFLVNAICDKLRDVLGKKLLESTGAMSCSKQVSKEWLSKQLQGWAEKFNDTLVGKLNTTRELNEWTSHFTNWLPKQDITKILNDGTNDGGTGSSGTIASGNDFWTT